MKIVTVDVSNLLAPTPKPIRLAVLCNRSPRYIAAYLRRRGNEGVMVYPFYTGKVEDVPSWSHVRRHDIAKPAYVGNLIPMKSAIDFIVNQFVSDLQRVGPVEIILDESNGA